MVLIELPVALHATDLALSFCPLLTIPYRVEFRCRFLRAFPATPSVAAVGLGGCYRATLPRRCSEDDLTFIAAAFLHRYIIGLGLRLLIRAEAVLLSIFVVSERTISSQSWANSGQN